MKKSVSSKTVSAASFDSLGRWSFTVNSEAAERFVEISNILYFMGIAVDSGLSTAGLDQKASRELAFRVLNFEDIVPPDHVLRSWNIAIDEFWCVRNHDIAIISVGAFFLVCKEFGLGVVFI